MPQCESAVVYDGLPISSGGAHGLGKIGARAAHAAWMDFLDHCTLPGGIRCYFALPDTPELAVSPKVQAAIEEAFPGDGRRYPVAIDRVKDALDLLASIEPQPMNQWGMAPVWFHFSTDFVLLRSDGVPWPAQDPAEFGFFRTPTGVQLGSSETRLTFEAKRSMGLSLSIPNATDTELASMFPWLQAHLPFRLSTRHWSRWTLAKNGRTYRGRKLTI